MCEEELFEDVLVPANSLYYVEAGRATLKSKNNTIEKKGEIAIIKQHSKLYIQKFRDKNGIDFKSMIIYLSLTL